jgi:acetyltransferase-like isoleucine patch superfamily enzyme
MSELQEQLAALQRKLREEHKSKWNRSLPFVEEAFGDKARWDRAKFLGFDEGASIYHNSYVYGDVKVGRNTWIGPFTVLDGSGGLSIGGNCSISTGAQMYTHETVEWALTGGKAKYRYAPVSIGDCCFMGSLSIVRMGVKIGNHVMVGAHSFVNSDIPSNSIAMGCPARIVGDVEVQGDKVKFNYRRQNAVP